MRRSRLRLRRPPALRHPRQPRAHDFVARRTGKQPAHERAIRTLMAWHRNWTSAWPGLRQRYDEPFRRMWNFYLLSCAGYFRARKAQLPQVWWGIAVSLYYQGKINEAVAAIDRVIALRPGDTESRQLKATFLESKKKK